MNLNDYDCGIKFLKYIFFLLYGNFSANPTYKNFQHISILLNIKIDVHYGNFHGFMSNCTERCYHLLMKLIVFITFPCLEISHSKYPHMHHGNPSS